MQIMPMNPLAQPLENAVRLLGRHCVDTTRDILLSWSGHSPHLVYSIRDRVMVFGPESPTSPNELMCLMFTEYHKMIGGCHCAIEDRKTA